MGLNCGIAGVEVGSLQLPLECLSDDGQGLSAALTVAGPAMFRTLRFRYPLGTQSLLRTSGKRDSSSALHNRTNTLCKTHTEGCDERSFAWLFLVRGCRGNDVESPLPHPR